MNLDQHPKRGVLKDIDKTTLLTMRENGLSNQEIAESAGCSTATVYNILGKQPPGIREPRATRRIELTQPPKAVNAPKDRIRVSHISLCGKFADFDVDLINGTVKIIIEDGSVVVNMDSLGGIISDFQDFVQEAKLYAR